jgi:membrane-bound lytic murein transglycosylase D
MRCLLAATAAVLLILGASSARAASRDDGFPRPYAIQPQIRFWTRVYTEVDTNGGLIHDAEHLDVVYETLRLPEGLSNRAFQGRVNERKEVYRRILLGLAAGRREDLSPDEQRVLQLWPTGVASETLRAAADDVRFQLGQADRFREGVVRSGRWEAHIRRTLQQYGVPPELAALPHVESSYNPEAYSRAGAAGIWQFMRKTARRFMRVDAVVDERFDPWRSSEAAAHFLMENYRATGTWPLAVTSYNHGAGGVRRAEQVLGTDDIGTIVRRYRSPSFGFASRNFYTSFLAALDVSADPERYFGAIERRAPQEPRNYVLPHPYSVGALQHAFAIDLDTLRSSNLALRTPFWRGRRLAPAGYVLRLPGGHEREADLALATSAPEPRLQPEPQVHARSYRVRRGDTLWKISHRFGVSERTLLAANHLGSRRLRPGARLTIPSAPTASPEEVAPTRVVAESAVAQVEPAPPSEAAAPESNAAASGESTANAEPAVAQADAAPRSEAAPPPPAPSAESAPAAGNAEPRVAQAEAAPQEAAPPEPAPAAGREEAPVAQAEASPPVQPEAATAPAPDSGSASAGKESVASTTPPEKVPDAESEAAPATASLRANSARYRVDAKGFIEVQPDETLGHYAQWLNVPASRLRSLNGLRQGRTVAIGRHLRLDFSRTPPATFEERRLAFHEALRREFFDTFEVSGTQQYVLRKGDTLWSLSRGEVVIPVWLLHQYNPDLDLASLRPGVRVTIPRLHKRGVSESAGELRQSEGA